MKKRYILRVMRLLILFLLAGFMHVAAAGYSQSITLTGKDIPFVDALGAIREQGGYAVTADKTLLKQAKPVTVDATAMPVEQFLTVILTNQPLEARIEGKTIVVKAKKRSTAISDGSPFSGSLQQVVAGIVTDEAGTPIEGVSIAISGKANVSVWTDREGRFSISGMSGKETILISHVGYRSQTILIDRRSTLKVTMHPEVMEEVVVIGYGSVQRKELTGAVSSVKGADLAKVPVQNISEALAGRLAGVQVTAAEGAPGAEISIRVRGGGSITQSNEPLYVIDGVPQTEGLNFLDPTDIESIDVLKDAVATAIYGARGANGVILVTTKQPKGGRVNVTYDTFFGSKHVTRTLPVLDPYQYVLLQYERSLGASDRLLKFVNNYGAFNDLEALYKGREGVNWQKELLGGSANSQYHKVGIDGGAGETRFNLFYSFNNDEGIMMNSGAKKHVTSLNLVHTGNKMKATGRINYSEQAIYGVGTSEGNSYFNQLQGLIFYRPTYGITGNDDDFVNLDEDPFLADDGAGDYFHSPITNALSQHRNSINKVLFMNGTIEYKLFKHLTYRGLVNVGTTSLKRDQFNDYRSSIAKRSGAPNGMIDGSSRNSWNYSNTLTYRDVFNKVHKLDVLVGQEQNYRQVSTNRITATGFPWETRGLDNLSEAAAFIVQSDKEDERLFSLFSRVNYSYKSRYLLSASFRADGSSKFGADNKYGYFPAAALAWRVTEEPFMRNQQLFSDVKFRFSIGTTGNNRIRNYSSLALLRTGNYPLNDNNNVSVYSNTLPNPALKWEQTRSTNIGLDLAVLRNRLQLTTELYRNRTTDLLLNADVPSITGYSTMLINVGSTSNHGLELTLSSINVDQSHFKWTTNLNIAFNRNKVLGLTSGSDLMYANSAWGVLSENDYLINVGRSLGQIYGYKADGLYQVDEFDYDATNGTYTLKEGIAFDVNNIPRPGFLKLIDQNGDLAINSDDRVIIGNANPRHIGGLNNTFSYKGFDLGVFINWSYGNQVYNANKLNMSQTHLDYRNTLAYVADRWMSIDAAGSRITDPVVLKESNAGKTVPVYNGAGAALRLHDGVIEDGSFLRINNINLGYSLPRRLVSSVKIQALRVHATVYNVYTITSYSGYDPEVSTRNSTGLTPGVDFGAYPRSFSLVVGANVSF